jgi:uncharacterized protein (TIGR03437 family)
MCLGAETFLIKSTDGGRSWEDIDPGPSHRQLVDLQVSADGSRLYALTITGTPPKPLDWVHDYSVVTSDDGGHSWHVLDSLGVTQGFAAMAVAPSAAGTVYVARGRPANGVPILTLLMNLVRTSDGGGTAEQLESAAEALRPFNTYPFACEKISFFGVNPAAVRTVFMAFDCGGDNVDPYRVFLLSRDGGLTWSSNSSAEWINRTRIGGASLPIAGVTQLLGNPGEPELVYARNQDHEGNFHLVRSGDGGGTWSAPMLTGVVTATLDPRNSAVLLASRKDGTLWRSENRAESWDQSGTWLPFQRLIAYPAQDSLVLAQAGVLPHQSLGTGEIMRSADGGKNWSVTPTGLDGFSFVFDPSAPNTIYGISERRLAPRLHSPYVRNLAGGSVLSSGSLFSIYGDDLGGRVTFDGQPANVLFASPRQINGLVPVGLKPGEVAVEVVRQPADGPPQIDRQSVTLSALAPVILHDPAGAPHVYHLDGGRQLTGADPALAGERIVVYCTGLDQAVAPYVQFWPTDHPETVQPSVSAEPVANQPGVYRVVIEVPRSLVAGSYLLQFWGGRNFGRIEVRRL